MEEDGITPVSKKKIFLLTAHWSVYAYIISNELMIEPKHDTNINNLNTIYSVQIVQYISQYCTK